MCKRGARARCYCCVGEESSAASLQTCRARQPWKGTFKRGACCISGGCRRRGKPAGAFETAAPRKCHCSGAQWQPAGQGRGPGNAQAAHAVRRKQTGAHHSLEWPRCFPARCDKRAECWAATQMLKGGRCLSQQPCDRRTQGALPGPLTLSRAYTSTWVQLGALSWPAAPAVAAARLAQRARALVRTARWETSNNPPPEPCLRIHPLATCMAFLGQHRLRWLHTPRWLLRPRAVAQAAAAPLGSTLACAQPQELRHLPARRGRQRMACCVWARLVESTRLVLCEKHRTPSTVQTRTPKIPRRAAPPRASGPGAATSTPALLAAPPRASSLPGKPVYTGWPPAAADGEGQVSIRAGLKRTQKRQASHAPRLSPAGGCTLPPRPSAAHIAAAPECSSSCPVPASISRPLPSAGAGGADGCGWASPLGCIATFVYSDGQHLKVEWVLGSSRTARRHVQSSRGTSSRRHLTAASSTRGSNCACLSH